MSERAFVDHLLELLEPFGPVTAKRMFGGYGIFRDGLMFGLVADSVLYFKVDDHNRADFAARELPPFTYLKNNKRVAMSYYQAPAETLDDTEIMIQWAASAYAAAQRAQKPKTK